VDASLTKTVRRVGSVAHQPAGYDKITLRNSRRNPTARRQGENLHAASDREKLRAVGLKRMNSSQFGDE
jgi:hypothetical protein